MWLDFYDLNMRQLWCTMSSEAVQLYLYLTFVKNPWSQLQKQNRNPFPSSLQSLSQEFAWLNTDLAVVQIGSGSIP